MIGLNSWFCTLNIALSHYYIPTITVGDATVEPTSSARKIGAVFDDNMSFENTSMNMQDCFSSHQKH